MVPDDKSSQFSEGFSKFVIFIALCVCVCVCVCVGWGGVGVGVGVCGCMRASMHGCVGVCVCVKYCTLVFKLHTPL